MVPPGAGVPHSARYRVGSLARQHEILLYLVGFAAALLVSLLLTRVVRKQATRLGLLDACGERKLHTEPVPRVGGVAIVLSLAVALWLVARLSGRGAATLNEHGIVVVLGGALAMHVLGLWDDIANIRARWKLAAQVAIAIGVYAFGLRMTTLSLPLFGVVHFHAGTALLFTVLWFVGITNAFNLIDGLDGLASGAALFALTTMFVVGSVNGQTSSAYVTIALAGATLGFLFYNFHPASIFLGDSGSLFLGFMLAGLGLLSSQKSPTVVAVAIPVVSLGLPVLDTAIAILRRFLRGQPIFSADRGHIHHRLLGLGHSPKKVALLLYGACAVLALGGMLLVNNALYVALVLVLVGCGVGLTVQKLRYYEFEEVAGLLRRGVQQRSVIGRRVRIREASARVAGLTDLTQVFAALARTFDDDQFMRAEVRLRRSFVDGVMDDVGLDRRLEDDVAVWTWSRNGAAHPTWWEIRLPFVGEQGDRIGSMVLWQDGLATETSLSHVHTIARELRVEVERKLLSFWPQAAAEAPLWPDRSVPIVAVDETALRAPARSRGTPAAARPPQDTSHRTVA